MPDIAIVRGDIVLVDLSGALGGEKQNDKSLGARPCVVVQNDGGNKGSPLTIVAPLTDESQYKGYPQQVKASAAELGENGKDSIIECGHLRSIDRGKRIKKNLGTVTPAVLARIDAALKASLGLR